MSSFLVKLALVNQVRHKIFLLMLLKYKASGLLQSRVVYTMEIFMLTGLRVKECFDLILLLSLNAYYYNLSSKFIMCN